MALFMADFAALLRISLRLFCRTRFLADFLFGTLAESRFDVLEL